MIIHQFTYYNIINFNLISYLFLIQLIVFVLFIEFIIIVRLVFIIFMLMLIKGRYFIFKAFEFGIFFLLKWQYTIVEFFQDFELFGLVIFVEFNASVAGFHAVIIYKQFIFFIRLIFHKASTIIYAFIFAFMIPF